MNDEYIKDFNKWNEVKQYSHSKFLPVDFFFLEREIWWASLGVNIGEEIDGKHAYFERPILVLKKISENTLWALPITSTNNCEGTFRILNHKKIRGAVLFFQMRFISGNRLLRLVTRIDEEEFKIIVKKLIKLLEETIPPLPTNR